MIVGRLYEGCRGAGGGRFAAVAVVAVVLLALCGACGRDAAHDALRRAESDLWDRTGRPVTAADGDSVLGVLETLDRDRLTTAEDKALYDLLLVKASAKAGVEEQNEEIIERATRVLDREGRTGRTGEAHYYNGLMAFRSGNVRKAVEEGLISLDIAESEGDEYREARAHELVADAYRNVYNLKAARLHREQAVDKYESSGFPHNAFYATMDLAGEYSHENNDSAYIVMDRARRLLDKTEKESVCQFEFIYADICCVLGDYRRSLEHYRKIDRKWLSEIMTPEDSVRIGAVYYHNGMPDSAANYFSTGASAEDISYWECMADKHERQGEDRLTLECYRNMRRLGNDRAGTSLANALESVERVFYEKKAAEERARHRRFVNMVWIAVALAAFVLLVSLIWRFYRKARALRAENDIKGVALMAASLPEEDAPRGNDRSEDPGDKESAQAGEGAESDNEKERWINVILDFYMSRLNAISREYFKETDPKRLREIEEEFDRELRSLRDGDIFDEIERRLNERNDGIAKKIRREFPKFNEQYVRLMLCSLAGLSSQSACLLLSIEKGNYYVMWTRIRNRIRTSEVPDRDLFMSLFCKK